MGTALLCAGLLAGCSHGTDDAEAPEVVEAVEQAANTIQAEPVGPVDYQEGVFEVDGELAQRVVVGDEILGVPVDRAGMLADREVGDIVFAQTDDQSFRLQITDIRRVDDQLQLDGRTPELEEVVKDGTFEAVVQKPASPADARADDIDIDEQVFDMNQGRLVDAATLQADDVAHHQQLMEADGTAFSWVYDETDGMPDDPPAAELREAHVGVHPGIVVRKDVTGGSPSVEMQVDVDMEITFDWLVQQNWAESFHISGTDLTGGSLPQFEFAGSPEYQLDPYIGVSSDFTVDGNGEFEQRFDMTGAASATVDDNAGHELSPQLVATNTTEVHGTIDDADADIGVDVELTLQDIGAASNDVLQISPLDANFESGTDIDLPNCQWEASLENVASVWDMTGYPDQLGQSDQVILDQTGNITGRDDCRPDESSVSCESDSDCPDMTVCGDDGYCQADGDVEIELEWNADVQPRADLGLFVNTPNGDTLHYEEPAGDDAALVESSCGGCQQANPSGNFHERVVFDNANAGDTFKIWVVNNEDGGVDDVDELGFWITIDHEDVFTETYNGTVPGGFEARSLYFVYTVPS